VKKGDLVRYVGRNRSATDRLPCLSPEELCLIIDSDSSEPRLSGFYYVRVLLSDGSTSFWIRSTDWEVVSESSCKSDTSVVQ
jgi:hypothetical protein